MATATTQAQELITCDLCIKPVQQFCNSCQVGLCEDCINKHVKSLKFMKHDIVPFTNRTVQLVFPQCTSHSHQRCEVHCQQCDVPVCIKCLTGQHKGHGFEDMADIIVKKKEVIKRETEEIEAMVLNNRAKVAEAENRISKSMAHFQQLEKKAKNQRKQWHIEVDNIFNNFESLIQSHRQCQVTSLKSCQSKLRSQISSMIQLTEENNKILKSNNVSDVNNYKSKVREYRDILQIPDLTLPSFQTNTVQGRGFSIELGEYKATLTQTSLSSLTDEVSFLSVKELLEEAKVIANIPTNVKSLIGVACVGSDKAWISGKDKMITYVDIHGAVQDTVTSTCKKFPADIAVTKQDELIYSDINKKRTVKIVRDGKIETLITTPRGWHPDGLCCTRSGDIIVVMCTTDGNHRKIVRYQGQRVIQEIEKDEHGDPIYQGGKHGVYVVENNNGDIVVSDLKADTVVVVNRTGKIRFRYNDKPPGGKESFCPDQIVTDSMGHIIVTDEFNNCLHILDQNGQFLRCVDNCGLEEASGLSVDSEGRLWVGLYNSGEVKVIQYMK